MNDFLNTFFFGIYPYLAVGVMIFGSILRYDRDPYSWKADSSQLMSRKGLRWGSNLFHVGIILLFFGHLVGLLTPHWAYEPFITAGQKQMVAMVAGGIFGVIAFIGMVILINRRFGNARVSATSSFWDKAILLMLFGQLVLGMLTIPQSAQHPDGSSMIQFANWAQKIVTFQGGAAQHILNQSIIFKLHIVLGLTIFLVFPFTRLVHMFSAPLKYLLRPGYQIVRKR
ncbi:MAG: respiratory nitrate reductase subunit gamma [Rhizobiaceae bacterium]|uniref:Respiratory nitrate reductase gamma chain n=1 Tax=hydrothermal vent metagenome TaxID=652676 RepID=A0A3B0SQB3_9ZZZZ|nr:respiratory nitrate reductase subunit gamma [Rhizobiaceae bacterium]